MGKLSASMWSSCPLHNCELVMIFCYIPLHSPGSAKLISVDIKHSMRSRETICISADKSLCLMKASSYRKSCDSQEILLWLMPLRYFFIFFLRQHWREKYNWLSDMFIYSRNILQLCPLSGHTEIFFQPVYWQSKSHTSDAESQIGNKVLFHFYPLKSVFSESFLLSQVTEIKSVPGAISFHLLGKNVLGSRMWSARCSMASSVISEPAPALVWGKLFATGRACTCGRACSCCSCMDVRSTLEKWLFRLYL